MKRWYVGSVIVAALVASACTTSGSGTAEKPIATTPSTTQQSSAPATEPSTSSAAPTTTASTSSTPATPTDCTADQITVVGTEPPQGSAAGHTGVQLLFTNHSSSPCILQGYPGVDGLDAAGHSIAHAKRTLDGYLGGCHCVAPPRLTLAPGGKAAALTEGSIGGPGDCEQFKALLVTPPNTSTSTRIPLVPRSCDFTVHPVLPTA